MTPTKTEHQKGTELEQAIGLIERTILQRHAKLSETSYTISFRKIIIVDDVKHEIDVWVEFDIGGGYKTIFIFEARNWKKRIGKDHIIVFSKKIEAAKAQEGFFATKAVTKYATAAAKRDPRIRILLVEDNFPNTDAIDRFHAVYRDRGDCDTMFELVIRPRADAIVPPAFKMDSAILILNGAPIDYRVYANELADQITTDHCNTVPSHTLADGVYVYEVSKEIPIAPAAMQVDGFVVDRIRLKAKYKLRVVRPTITSKFSIETRGRVYTFEPVHMGDYGPSQVTFIETFL